MTSSTKSIISLSYRKRRGGGLVEVEFDDGSIVALDAELCVQFHLKTGLQLNEGNIEDLRRRQETLEARRKLIRYLSLRRKTRRQCEEYLSRANYSDPAIQDAIQRANELGYIDDEQYAHAYTRTQVRSSRKGPRAIRHELHAQGVHEDIVEQAIAPVNEPEKQREAAMELARKRLPSYSREPAQKARQKLYQYLARKGYDSDVAGEVVRECFGESEESV